MYFDASNANLITLDDGVWITARCLLLCHKRDMAVYHQGDDINNMPYVHAPIHICKGVHIGMGSIVTKDIPAWSIAVGSPAKVVKTIE